MLLEVFTLLSLFSQSTSASFFDALTNGDFTSLSLWPQRRFQTEGLVDAGSLGLNKAQGMVAAVGDVNGDQTLDLFLLSPDQHSLRTYVWDKSSFKYKEAPGSTVVNVAPRKIINVAPADLNRDGRLDLLVMSAENPGSWWSDDHVVHLDAYLGQGGGHFQQPISLPSAGQSQPMLLDAQGNMSVDLLGLSEDKKLARWKNLGGGGGGVAGEDLFELVDASTILDSTTCDIPDPHSNAFIDLDGDCLADLFLTCRDPADSKRQTYEILINKKDEGFVSKLSGRLPPGAGQVSFADMDRDGTIDMVFPSCSSDGCFINIAYNQQMPLCDAATPSNKESPSTSACRDPTQLCQADPDFKFDLSLTSPSFVQLRLADVLPDRPHLVLSDSSFSGTLPISMKLGDYNQDSFPDILVLSAPHRDPSEGRPTLLQSVPCSTHVCGDQAAKQGRRMFEPVKEKVNVLESIDDAKLASFVDIDEKGSLDIMVQRRGGSGVNRHVQFVKNNIFHDAFFLKALVVNGACEPPCLASEPGSKPYLPYGVSYAGASFKFTVFDPRGQRKAQQVGQLPSTSYLSLLTPYAYLGLGRTNNYVENLFVGSTRHQSRHYASFESLIPNSQVLIVPFQPPGGTDPGTWIRQLYLHPGDWIPGVTLSLTGAMLVLGGIIFFLHLKELREDEAERKKNSVHINFDAL